MPTVSRAFIKSGMLFFVIALVIGVIKVMDINVAVLLQPVFWHALMLGWITQIIFGVSLWMFPGRSKTEDYRSQFLPWVIFYTLNTGLILRFIFEPFADLSQTVVKYGLVTSAILQLLASFSYFIEMWPRVISKEKRLDIKRIKKGEV